MATNTVNGKRYIGATKFTLEKRKSKHLFSAFRHARNSDCPRFYPALRKYGSDNFEWTTLATYDEPSEAFEAEARLITELQPEYNITGGGRGAFTPIPWNRKKVMCLETGQIFESLEAAASFYSTRSGNIAAVCRGHEFTCKGKHFIYYTNDLTEKERLDTIFGIDRYVIRKRRKLEKPTPRVVKYPACSASNPRKRTSPVVCVSTGRTFNSIAEAAVFYNITATSISALCKGRDNRKTAGGLIFKYSEKQHSAKLVYAKSIGPRRPFGIKWTEARRAKMLPQLRDANERKASQSKISAELHKGNKYHLGKKLTDKTKDLIRAAQFTENAKVVWSVNAAKGPRSQAKPVLCKEDNLVFESARAAAKYYGLNNSTIAMVCAKKPHRHTAGGRHFEYVTH